MKKYPPRIHDKSKRINKAGWPRELLHSRCAETPTVWRPIKGLLMRIY